LKRKGLLECFISECKDGTAPYQAVASVKYWQTYNGYGPWERKPGDGFWDINPGSTECSKRENFSMHASVKRGFGVLSFYGSFC